jgi:hypothetical protein
MPVPAAAAQPVATPMPVPVAAAQPAPVQPAVAEPYMAAPGVEVLPAAEKAPRKPIKINVKKLLMVTVPAAVLAIAAIVVITIIGNVPPYAVMSDLTVLESDGKVLVVTNNGTVLTINGEYSDHQVSLCGRRAAIMVDASWREPGTLWYIDGTSSPAKIADEVYGFVLADSGNGVAFFTDYDERDNIATLKLFNGSSATIIDHNTHFEGGNGFAAISPDGKSLFFATDVEISSGWSPTVESRVFVSVNGGKPEQLNTRDVIPVAVADNARFLYFGRMREGSSTFMAQAGLNGEANRISGDDVNEIFFNKDYSQAIVTSWVRSSISVNGGEGQSIINSAIEGFIIPESAQTRVNNETTVYGFSDFRNQVFLTGNNELHVLRLNGREYERERITSNAQEAVMTKDGKQVFYNNWGTLRVADLSNIDADHPTVARNISSFVVGTGGVFYYVNSSGVLFRSSINEAQSSSGGGMFGDFGDMLGGSGVNAGTQIRQDVRAASLTISSNGTVFFITDWSRNNGTLRFSTGTNADRVQGSGEVSLVWAGNGNVFYMTDEGDIFRSSGNANFTRIAQDSIPRR